MSLHSKSALLGRRISPAGLSVRRPKLFQLNLPFAPQSISKPGQQLGGKRYEITAAGDHKSGHIEASPNEGILFFNNIYPLKLQWLFQHENFVQRLNSGSAPLADLQATIKRALPDHLPVKITGVLPRFKEGGAFVRFSHDERIKSEELEGTLKEHLRTDEVKPWWNPFVRIHTGLVRGRPWVEDLRRLPTCRLKVEFVPPETGAEATEMSQEQLYSVFRPYGTLAEIISQPTDSKVLPKYAIVDFARTKRAIMAKNCLHGFNAFGDDSRKALAKLKISYERKVKPNWIMDWLVGHPRIVIPLLAAVVATLTVAIFDPIRTFFVKAHVTRVFHVSDNKFYKWFVSRAKNFVDLGRKSTDNVGLNAIWDDRKDQIEQIQKWLLETADTFIVVQGARGSGKRELVVDQALKHRKNTLIIDCKPIQEARSDSTTIDAMAQEVGYRPVFSWMNSMSGLLDLAAQGATGMKTGFSETLDSQLAKILNNTATALKEISLENRKNDDKDTQLSEDSYLEAHPEKRPVVIIDNFLHKNQESSVVYDKLAEWAARITSANVAHVIFLTTDVSFSKSLSKALPDRVFRQLSLGDTSPEAAKRFVISHLDSDPSTVDPATGEVLLTPSQRRKDLAELDNCISLLGGRFTDLEFLARRIKAGETPTKAIKEIVDQSASEILKMYIFNAGGSSNSSDSASRKWTQEQAWHLIKSLAKTKPDEPLRYSDILLSDLFKPDADAIIAALEQAELISISSDNGRPAALRPGKPVYQSAFVQLTQDRVLRARLDVATNGKLIAMENAAVDKCEAELRLLGELPRRPRELDARVGWLLKKVRASQERIEAWEAETAVLKKVLRTEY